MRLLFDLLDVYMRLVGVLSIIIDKTQYWNGSRIQV